MSDPKLDLDAPIDFEALEALLKKVAEDDVHFKHYPPSADTLNKLLD